MNFSEKGAQEQTKKKMVQLKLLYNKTPERKVKIQGRLREDYFHI